MQWKKTHFIDIIFTTSEIESLVFVCQILAQFGLKTYSQPHIVGCLFTFSASELESNQDQFSRCSTIHHRTKHTQSNVKWWFFGAIRD